MVFAGGPLRDPAVSESEDEDNLEEEEEKRCGPFGLLPSVDPVAVGIDGGRERRAAQCLVWSLRGDLQPWLLVFPRSTGPFKGRIGHLAVREVDSDEGSFDEMMNRAIYDKAGMPADASRVIFTDCGEHSFLDTEGDGHEMRVRVQDFLVAIQNIAIEEVTVAEELGTPYWVNIGEIQESPPRGWVPGARDRALRSFETAHYFTKGW
jgi:hypothetical protein